MELLTGRYLKARHGFPTRRGGVSQGPFASLNCGVSTADEPAAVAENVRRLAAAAGVDVSRLATVSQVHGDVVRRANPGWAGPEEGDAVWTDEPGVAVAVRTADCLPILMEDPVGRRVAAVHAGWRGVLSLVAVRALEQLVAAGTRVADVRVVLGPCIGPCCFEVDGDLPERFAAAFGEGVVVTPAGQARHHLDLQLSVVGALTRAGVPAGQVERLEACTACDAGRFFSHRRDRGVTGRHLSFITCDFGGTAL